MESNADSSRKAVQINVAKLIDGARRAKYVISPQTLKCEKPPE
jgi:hypothetical protein